MPPIRRRLRWVIKVCLSFLSQICRVKGYRVLIIEFKREELKNLTIQKRKREINKVGINFITVLFENIMRTFYL